MSNYSNTVYLNVYDIIPHNCFLYTCGIGVHHTGIEVYGKEYGFGRCQRGTGLFNCDPHVCGRHVFREALVLGATSFSPLEVTQLMEHMQEMPLWSGMSYHLLQRNCNHFSDQFAKMLIPIEKRLYGEALQTGAVGTGGDMATNAPSAVAVYLGGGEDVESPTGRVGRRLVPLWINRLSSLGASLLPQDWVAKLDSIDKAAQGIT